MSGFIPMVSTTPPPIDDFGDFMDSTQQDEEFGDFSSAANNYDDDSYPSLNSPPEVNNSMTFPSEDEASPAKVLSFSEKSETKLQNDKEVETIFRESELGRSDKIDFVTSPDNDGTASNDDSTITDPGYSITKPECNGFISPNSKSDEDAFSVMNDEQQTQTNDINSTSSNSDIKEVDSDTDDWLDFKDESPKRNKDFQDIAKSNTTDTTSKIFHGSPEPDFKESKDIEAEILSQEDDSNLDLINDEINDFDKEENFMESGEKSPKSSQNFKSDFGDFQTTDDNSISLTSLPSHGAITSEELDDIPCETTLPGTPDDDEPHEQDLEDDFAGFNDVQFATDASNYQGQDSDESANHIDSSEKTQDAKVSSSGINNNQTENEISETVSLSPDNKKAKEIEQQSVAPDNKTLNIDAQSDDEFGAFSSNDIPKYEDANSKTLQGDLVKPTQTDSFECDFGAFESTTEASDGDGFANFSTASTSEKNLDNNISENDADFGDFATGESDDDFGDFSTGSTATWHSIPNTVQIKLAFEDKVASFVSKYMKRKEEQDSMKTHIPLVDERLSTDVENHSTVSGESTGISCSGELWDQLEDIDNTIALNFIWNGSGHNKHLLDSLGMHTQNILFSGTKQAYYVPTYYAAGLGLIDPDNKGILKPMSAAEKITAMSPTDKNAPISQEEALQTPEVHTEWKSIADNHGSGDGMIVDDSWSHCDEITSNSGFQTSTTPGTTDIVDPIPIISSSMDLDYFDNLSGGLDGVKSPVKSDLIDPELLELTTAPTTEPPPPPKDSGTATLSKILASIKSSGNSPSPSITTMSLEQDTSKWEDEESKLSSEARSVLRRLPYLSYMRSKALVFPINMSGVNIGEDM